MLSSVLTSLTGSSLVLYDDDDDVPALPTSWRALQVVAVVVLGSAVQWCFYTSGPQNSPVGQSHLACVCLKDVDGPGLRDMLYLKLQCITSTLLSMCYACVVTLDPQDHHGANPQFVCFFFLLDHK